MATAGKNLSHYNPDTIPNAKPFRFGLVVSEWNATITQSLCHGARETLIACGALPQNIIQCNVPGSFELVYAAKKMLQAEPLNAIIAIGSIIRGETYHFEIICNATAQGIKDINIHYNTPVIFCVLTDDTLQQAIDRSGGKHGNKGIEAAIAAIKMAEIASK
jgi:6,7-dimethyl-8-ribityllumazine synthase